MHMVLGLSLLNAFVTQVFLGVEAGSLKPLEDKNSTCYEGSAMCLDKSASNKNSSDRQLIGKDLFYMARIRCAFQNIGSCLTKSVSKHDSRWASICA